MKNRYIISEVVNGIPLTLVSSSGVFSKKELDLGTRMLLENLRLPEAGIVADIGCGYGAIGIYIALRNPNLKIYMIDVNHIALKLTQKNIKINGVEKNTVIVKSDIFGALPLEVKFNAIYSNPPLSKGVYFLEKLEAQSYDRLAEKGFIQLVVYKGETNVEKIFTKRFKIESIKRKKGYSIITIVKD